MDASFVGRTWPARTYRVGAEKVREFARAVGATDAVHTDVEAARVAGHADVVAPPTFPVVFTWEATREVVDDPALGLDFTRVVHRDQSFELHRPVVAGDVLTTVVTVAEIKELAGNDVVTFRCDVTDPDGVAVLVSTATLVGRAGADA
nr:MaoC family dehydratase N-terminal domain-containing protein [Actinomycetospora corticicola]